MLYFKLLSRSGSHAEIGPDGQAVVYKASEGRVIASESDLVARFPGKFERVHVGGTPEAPAVKIVPVAKPAPVPVVEAVVTAAPDKVEEDKTALGRDVTKRFPRAAEEDFKVFSTGGAFFVTDADCPTVPLHDKPLKKKDVLAFVEQYLKG